MYAYRIIFSIIFGWYAHSFFLVQFLESVQIQVLTIVLTMCAEASSGMSLFGPSIKTNNILIGKFANLKISF